MLGQAESRYRLKRIYIHKIMVTRHLRTQSKNPCPLFHCLSLQSCLASAVKICSHLLNPASLPALLSCLCKRPTEKKLKKPGAQAIIWSTEHPVPRSKPYLLYKNRSQPYACVLKVGLFHISCVKVGRGNGQLRSCFNKRTKEDFK